jgi:hypothetical protein
MLLAGLLALIFAAAAGLLLVAGAVKLRRPACTRSSARFTVSGAVCAR